MKYSQKATWQAIFILLPAVKYAKEQGIAFNLPTMLEKAAVCTFIDADSLEFKLSFEKNVAAYVVRLALAELSNTGSIKFEDCDELF